MGQMVIFVVQFNRALFHDEQAVLQCVLHDGFGVALEETPHFVVGFQVVPLVREAQFGVLYGGAGLDAEQHVVRGGVGGTDVMHVVGSQKVVFQAKVGRHFD